MPQKTSWAAWVARARRAFGGWGRKPAAAGWLQQTSWREFMMLVADAFRLQGYGVIDPGAGAACDLVLRRGGETSLVQCRHWKALNVGVEVVRELQALMASRGAATGFVLTAGGCSAQARTLAHEAGIQLVDGAQLVSMVQQARAQRMAETAPAPLDARPG